MSVAAGSDNQNAETRQAGLRIKEKNFELMDSLYKAAVQGHIDEFKAHANILDHILTPKENTILHIHITARAQPNNTNGLWNWNIGFKKKPSEEDIPRENFVREILELCPGLLHKVNTKGEALLHIAGRHGHADIVKDLIAECKRPHQIDPEKGVEATKLMLGMTNEAKDTAMHEAVRYNQADVVKILTKEDPELSYDANNAGETPLYLAAERGYEDVMKDILLTCKSPAYQGPMGRSALHAAAIRGDIEIIKLLLESKGTLTSKPDQQGWLPLHLAAYLGHYYVVKELLKADKSAAYKADNEGKIPLHLAASKGRVYTMEDLILSCPSCCEIVDNKGWNVFHFALDSNSRRAVQLLLKFPSLQNLINEKNDDGNTPFLEHAASGTFIKSFVCHPKVDTLAFDRQNNNAIDTIVLDRVIFPWPELRFLGCLHRLGGHWCTRHIARGRGDRKDEGNNAEGHKRNNRKEKNSARDKEYNEYIKEAKDSHLVVAALIATVTFTAGITMPGGYVNEKGPDQGAAVLSRSKAFQAFIILNTVSMIFSTSAVFIHLFLSQIENKKTAFVLWKLNRALIIFALFSMVLAFLTGTYSVLYSAKAIVIVVFVIAGLFFLIYDQFGPLGILLRLLSRLVDMMIIKLGEKYQGILFRRFQ